MDIADQAEVRIEREMQAILDAHAAQQAGAGISADLCEDCGLEIASARQLAAPGVEPSLAWAQGAGPRQVGRGLRLTAEGLMRAGCERMDPRAPRLAAHGAPVRVLHLVEILDKAYGA